MYIKSRPKLQSAKPACHYPEKAARKLLETASATRPAEYSAGLNYAIEKGWLWLHESGTFVKFTPAGAELFA